MLNRTRARSYSRVLSTESASPVTHNPLPDPPPLPVVVDEHPFLTAHGDSEQLIVHRNPLVRDTDPIYQPVREHIAANGMVLLDRQTRAGGMMWGQDEASWYVVPQLRIGLLDYTFGEAKLPYPDTIEPVEVTR